MSAQTAAESLILEFVAGPEFEAGLQKFMQGGSVQSDNVLGIMRQYVNSPVCEEAHKGFWNNPRPQGPEHQFDEPTQENSHD
jgi:hypothetical protein